MILLKNFFVFLLLLLSFLNINASTRNFRFKHLSSEQGLPGVNVVAIHQDKYGVMWFGIEAVGLCRYDGTSFQIFGSSETDSTTISNNFVTTISEDKEGNLWVGTLNGVNIFNPITYSCKRLYHHEGDSSSICGNGILSINSDSYGNMWVGTNSGLSIYNKNKQTFFNYHTSSNHETPTYIYDIFKSSANDMYIGTREDGMFIFSSQETDIFNKQIQNNTPSNLLKLSATTHFPSHFHYNNKKININILHSFAEYSPDSILLAVFENLYIYHPKTKEFEKIELQRNLPNMPVAYEKVNVDKKGNIWCGSTSNGLVYYDLKTKQLTDFYYYSNPNTPIKTTDIRDIFIDKSGLVWIGGKFEGIYIYNFRQEVFSHIQLGKEGDNDAFVLSVCAENDSTVWLGTRSGRLKKFNPLNNSIEYLKYHGNDKTINDKRIQTLQLGNKHTLYAGALTGLWEFNTKTGNSKLYKSTLINSILNDKNIVWIGTQTGIFYFDKTTKKISRYPSKYKNIFNDKELSIYNFLKGKDDNIWIATAEHGLLNYYPDNDSIISYTYTSTDTTTISGNMVRGLLIDSKGILWVGTKANGLNKYNEKKNCFERIKVTNKLSTRTIYSITEDKEHNLWMSTHNGIIEYFRSDNKITNYSVNYGLQGKVFELNATEKLGNGNIIMGGKNGLNIFNPSSIKKHKYNAPFIISKFKIYDKIVDQNISKPKEYKLGKKSDYITFEYALMDYADPDNNTYKYRLLPLNNEWINNKNRTFVSYTNLPGGKYTFEVQGKNEDGVLSENALSLTFKIPTPLVKRSWFQFLSILFFGLIIFLIVVARIKSVKHRELMLKKLVTEKTKALTAANNELIEHRENLEKLVNERTRDLEKAKEKAEDSDRLKSAFLANMSHEIRTPLNAILGFTTLISTQAYSKEEMNDMTEIIQSNGSALLQLINDIIDISMIEANQLEIVKNKFDINYLFKEIQASYKQQVLLLKNKQNVKILADIPEVTSLFINTDRERLKQIFNNLFSNAIKFTDKGFIKIGYTVDEKENKILFYIEDSGIGIENKYLQEIFTRFRKIENNRKELYRGTGLGLSICSNLISLLDGEITVKSELGKGTIFNFTLPIN